MQRVTAIENAGNRDSVAGHHAARTFGDPHEGSKSTCAGGRGDIELVAHLQTLPAQVCANDVVEGSNGRTNALLFASMPLVLAREPGRAARPRSRRRVPMQ
jgi:hypothetical protein